MSVLNRVHTRALKKVTPLEAWTGRKSSLIHLRTFGCIAHAKVVKLNLKNMEDRAIPIIYLGTEVGCKALKFYNPTNGSIVISRDAEFRDELSWGWKDKSVDPEVTVAGNEH